MSTRLFVLAFLLCCVTTVAAPIRSDKDWAIHPQVTPADWQALVQSSNLIAGMRVQSEPPPNDHNTGGDLKCLTDGVLAGAEGRMWSDKRAVGWGYQPYARLTFDLGQPQPLGQVVMRLQLIDKTNPLPKTLTVALSNDGDAYTPVRNLSAKVHPEDNPALTYEPLPTDVPGIYAVVLNLGYQARYVRLDFALQGFLVCDEIAVLPAAGALKPLPPAPPGKREYRDNVFDRRDQYRQMIAPGNLMLGKPLSYSPVPTQYLNVDEGDPLQLTDGQFGERTDERIWFERGCVGWQGPSLMTIFADLEQVQPIGSVVIRLLGGHEQNALEFPDEIRVLLSNDGKDYYQVSARHKRGLDDLSAEAWDLPEENLAWVHNFQLPVGRKARYVAVQLRHQKQFAVSDEMAVVKGPDNLPALQPDPARQVVIVTEGVAFTPIWGNVVPVCQNLPLRARFAFQDARAGAAAQQPCKLVLDLPETVKFVVPADQSATDVEHEGRKFKRYVVNWTGEGTDFFLQSLLPPGKTDVLYTSGDSGQGPQNERKITWQSLVIPKARLPKRLHVSLSWQEAPWMFKCWPDYINAQKHLGFNAVGMQPCYWYPEKVPEYQAALRQIRAGGLKLIQIESPAGALAPDRRQDEIKSLLPDGKFGHVCPSYRGQYYQKELSSFAQNTVWIDPDFIFYDVEAYWPGAVQEAADCSRCQERFKTGNFKDWDAFRAAMGRETHVDQKAAIEKARAAAGAIVAAMDHLGVEMACLNKWNCPDIHRGNDDVAAALRGYPGRFAGFAATAPALGPEANRVELRRCFDELGFQGIKVHNAYETLPFRDTAAMRVSTQALEAIWEFCHERKCPVLCHGFLTPEYARVYPEARFLAAHAGGCRHYTELFEGCENVYFDTAASTTLAGTIEHFVAEGWEDRVVYGSDLPYASQPYRFGQVVTARVPDPIMRKILGGNMARTLGLDMPARYR